MVIDNDSLSVVARRLVLNPQIGMGGKRRNKAGQLDPYVDVEDFINRFINTQDTFLDVCLAYNLFGLTEVWFSRYIHLRWDQLNWGLLKQDDHLEVLVNEHYPDVSRLIMANFHSLAYDLRQAFQQDQKVVPENPYGGYSGAHFRGDYDEQGQAFAAHGEPVTIGRLPVDEGEGEEPGVKKKEDKTMMYALLAAGGGALLYFNS